MVVILYCGMYREFRMTPERGGEYCWADTVLENGNLVCKGSFHVPLGRNFVPIGWGAWTSRHG